MESEEVITPQSRRTRSNSFMVRARFIRRYGLWIVILILIIFSMGFFEIGRYTVYLEHPGLSGEDQAATILNKVGQLIQLPQNETPTMATITNAAAVKATQPFLASAENGDVLIVYQNAQTALLYRPSTNKLIAVGPVTTNTPSQSVPQQVTVPVTTPNEIASTTAKTTTNVSSTSAK